MRKNVHHTSPHCHVFKNDQPSPKANIAFLMLCEALSLLEEKFTYNKIGWILSGRDD